MTHHPIVLRECLTALARGLLFAAVVWGGFWLMFVMVPG